MIRDEDDFKEAVKDCVISMLEKHLELKHNGCNYEYTLKDNISVDKFIDMIEDVAEAIYNDVEDVVDFGDEDLPRGVL